MTDWQMLGSLADWATAGAALLALIVATIAGIATWRTNTAQQKTLELQRIQFNDAKEQLKRSQAEHIAGWIAGEDHETVGLYLCNTSNLPVYNVFVRLELLRTPGEAKLESTRRLHTLPPDNSAKSDPNWNALIFGVLTDAEPAWRGSYGAYGPTMFELSITFTDASGQNWERKPSGKLVRLNDES
jgi:hypothetical protein